MKIIDVLKKQSLLLSFLKKPYAKIVLKVLAVPIVGLFLLTITFLLDYFLQSMLIRLMNTLSPGGSIVGSAWYPTLIDLLFTGIVLLLSWSVFRTKLRVFFKAIYLTVPTAVVEVTIGVYLHSIPAVSFLVIGLLVAVTVYYFYKTKQPWLYYYSLLLITAALAASRLAGGSI